MPIIFADIHTCKKCRKEFEWSCFELTRQNIDSPQFKVETIPQGITLAHKCQQRDNGIYDIEVNCPHCNFDNHFTYMLVKTKC